MDDRFAKITITVLPQEGFCITENHITNTRSVQTIQEALDAVSEFAKNKDDHYHVFF